MSSSSIWPIDRTLTDVTTQSQSGPGSNGNDWVLHIPQSSSIRLFSLITRILIYGGIPFSRDAVGVFYSPSGLEYLWEIIKCLFKVIVKMHFCIIYNWLVGWFLRHINLCRLFNAKSIFMQIVVFQTIQFCMSTQFNCRKHFYFKLFNLFKQF